MNKEIQDKIDVATKDVSDKEFPLSDINQTTTSKELDIMGMGRMSLQIGFTEGATFGYSLSQSEIDEKDKQLEGMRKDTDLWIEREKLLEAEINQLKQDISTYIVREAVLEKEIKRLKGLIEKEITNNALSKVWPNTTNEHAYAIADKAWEQFKAENNL